MTIDENLLLFCLAKQFDQAGITICKKSRAYIKNTTAIFNDLDTESKLFYGKYSSILALSLIDYLGEVTEFIFNVDDDDVIHDFRLKRKKDEIPVSFSHRSIAIYDVFPKKMMQHCGYKKNTKISKNYYNEYAKINKSAIKKIENYEKYSDISIKEKSKYILDPITELVINTLSNRRKCAQELYEYLFSDRDRLVVKLYEKRFVIYDFTIETEDIRSFKLTSHSNNTINIVFNNGASFKWTLQTNSVDIKSDLSIKFHNKFINLDEIFAVSKSTI